MSAESHGLVLLDAAGTLIYPSEPVEDTYARYFSQFGWKADPQKLRASFRATFASLADPDFSQHEDGETAERAWWRQVVAKTASAAGIVPEGKKFERCFDALFGHYSQGAAWAVFPEVRGILQELRAAGWKLAVVSNFDGRLRQVLDELGLTAQVDLVLTSSDVRARKPNPALLERAISAFPNAQRVCLVGDSAHADGGAAAAAGVPVFLVDRPEIDLRSFVDWLKMKLF